MYSWYGARASVPSVIDRGRAGSGEAAQTWQALVALAVAAYIGTAVVGDRASATTAAVTYVVILIISVVLHEAGHAIAVLAIGGRVREVRLGFGPPLIGVTGRGVHWDIRPLVIAGHVGWEPPPQARRNALIAVAGAGIAVHLVLIVVATVAGSGPWAPWRIDLLIANVLSVLSNAIPSTMSVTTTSAGPNDGAHLRDLLAAGGEARARRSEPAWRRADRDASAHLWQLISAGLPDGSDPASAAGRLLADAAVSLDTLEGALAAGVPNGERPGLILTVALGRLAAGRNADAERLAAAAVSQLPMEAEIERGAALSTLGWAMLRQGRRPDAERLLGQALALDPTQPLTAAFATALSRTPRA
jgi:hypothetical protein